MSSTRLWLVACAAAALLPHFSFGVPAWSNESLLQPDAAASAATIVNSAWTEYERSVENLRSNIRQQLKSADDAALSEKAKSDAIAKAREAFLSGGVLPDLGDADQRDRWRETYARHAADLLKKYERAIITIKDDESPVRASLKSDLEQLRTSWDLTPWRDAIAKGASESERTLTDAGGPLTLTLDGEKEYRLQVRARRTGGSGTLRIEAPGTDGAIVEFAATPRADGVLDFGFTAWDGQIGAIRGATGVPMPTGRTTGKKRDVVLRAADAAFIVDSVQYKEVRRQELPGVGTPQKRVVPQPVETAKQVVEDALRAGARGTGRVTPNDRDAAVQGTVVVQSRDGNQATIDLTYSGLTLRLSCVLTGKSITITGADVQKGRFNRKSFDGGSGTIEGNSLNLRFKVRGGRNQAHDVTLIDARMR